MRCKERQGIREQIEGKKMYQLREKGDESDQKKKLLFEN